MKEHPFFYLIVFITLITAYHFGKVVFPWIRAIGVEVHKAGGIFG